MEREIKFRGVACSGDVMTYGVYCVVDNMPYIVQINDGFSGAMRFISVNQNTVGQFTGFKDKNGVEIFEGDLFMYHEHGGYLYESFTGCVSHKYGSFGFSVDERGYEYFNPFFKIDELKEDFLDHMEVVGNIHDK